MARPKKIEESHPVHIILPAETVAGLDAWVEEVRTEVPGGSGITRADLMRDILKRAVDDRQKTKKGGRRP